jgi:CHAD domain-containing protein/CYTH domain-containing protein
MSVLGSAVGMGRHLHRTRAPPPSPNCDKCVAYPRGPRRPPPFDDDLPMRIDDRAMDLSAEEGARLVALGLLAEATAAADALAAGAGEEPLHDFRVAIRRLRSALRTFRPWLEDSVRPRHEKRLKKLARSTNEARDAEVQLAWLASKRDALASVRQRPGYELVVERFEGRAHRGPDAARVAARYRRRARKLEARLRTYERKVDPGGEVGAIFAGVLASLVGDQVRALCERMSAIQDASDDEGVHRARIEGKRLRYLLEPLRGYGPADASEVIRHLKRLQDVLGDLHDTHVLAGELREALVDAAAEQARRLHAAVYAHGASDAALRELVRAGPRPGLLALVRLARERCDALYADLEREWRGGGMDAFAAEAQALASAIEARAGGKLEHERKFLLAALPPKAAEDAGVEIAQGWLPGDRLRERIRRVRGPDGERYWRGLKRGAGGVRLEAEEETTREVFEALWPLTEGHRVAKRRHEVREGSLVWEIDEFTDRELVLAEVELPARASRVALPDWLEPLVVRDVTDDPAFLNENLAARTGAPPSAEGSGAPRLDAPAAAGEHPRDQA